MKKIAFFVFIAIIFVAAVWGVGFRHGSPAPLQSAPEDMYSNETFGFAAPVPSGFTVDESYLNQNLGPGREIPGVAFRIPSSMATGTNLSTDSNVAIEELSDVDCVPSDFLDAPSQGVPMTIGGNSFVVASSSGAGAGNLYEETVYITQKESRCYAVHYFIHSGNIHNYPDGAVKEFDRQGILSAFGSVVAGLELK